MAKFLRVAPRLPVSDLSRAMRFYTEVLGFGSGDPWPADKPMFVLLHRDDVIIQLYVPEEMISPGPKAMLSIDVDDAVELCNHLKNRTNIDWGPEIYWYGRREFAVTDPDGHLVIFSEETDEAPTCEE